MLISSGVLRKKTIYLVLVKSNFEKITFDPVGVVVNKVPKYDGQWKN